MTATEPTTTLPAGTRVRTTKAWADAYRGGLDLTGVVAQVLPVGPLRADRTHQVKLNDPPGGNPTTMWFNPAELEPDNGPASTAAPAKPASRSPQWVLAENLTGARGAEWEAAGRLLAALTRAGYAVVQIEEPDEETSRV